MVKKYSKRFISKKSHFDKGICSKYNDIPEPQQRLLWWRNQPEAQIWAVAFFHNATSLQSGMKYRDSAAELSRIELESESKFI